MAATAPANVPRPTWTPPDRIRPFSPDLPQNNQSTLVMHLVFPIAAAGYSLVYLLFGGGLIFVIAKMLGR